MIYKMNREQQLQCDIQTAWEFFSSPNNLSRITPKDMGFKVLTDTKDKNIFVGMKIDYIVAPILRIPMKWQTKITQVDFENSFTDFQEKGPYKLWNHHHVFIANGDGVLMVDVVHYELPFGPLGNLAHNLFVKRKLNQLFDFRFQTLEKMFNQKK